MKLKEMKRWEEKKKTIKWNEVLPYNFSGIFADSLNQPKCLENIQVQFYSKHIRKVLRNNKNDQKALNNRKM